jgi:ribosome-associated toxin RatA of RatAB toxin-antitoxin module
VSDRSLREFHGEAAEVVAAPAEDCFVLLAAVDDYPEWCPDNVRDVQVLDRGAGGQPTRVRMTMHVERGPIAKDFDLFLAVVVEPPREVTLRRVTDHPTNQEFNAIWSLRPHASTRLALALDAKLRVPSFIPARGVGDAIAEAFVTAARAALAPSQ